MSADEIKRRQDLLVALVRFVDKYPPEGFDSQRMFLAIATGQFEKATEYLNTFKKEIDNEN